MSMYQRRSFPLLRSDYIVLDTETTGLNPASSKVLEIAAIKYHRHVEVDRFHEFIDPQCPIPPAITAINGIDNDTVKGKRTIGAVLDDLNRWLENYWLVGHNIAFDVGMLNAEAIRTDKALIQSFTVDTVALSRSYFKGQGLLNHRLETIKNHLGISTVSHRGMNDVEVTAAIYQLVYQKQKRK